MKKKKKIIINKMKAMNMLLLVVIIYNLKVINKKYKVKVKEVKNQEDLGYRKKLKKKKKKRGKIR